MARILRGVTGVVLLLLATKGSAATSADLTITHDMLWNTRGGIDRNHRQITNAQLVLSHDFAAPAEGGRNRLYGNLFFNTGENFSNDVTGDAQVVSNIEAYDTPCRKGDNTPC